MSLADTLQTLVKDLSPIDENDAGFHKNYFGEAIKLLRISSGLFQDDIPGLTKSEVKQLENGHVHKQHLRLFFEHMLNQIDGADDGDRPHRPDQ